MRWRARARPGGRHRGAGSGKRWWRPRTSQEAGGTGEAQALLWAGLLDEMEIHLVPVLLGGGRRLFDSLGPGHIELELARRLAAPDVTHLRYRVRGQGRLA